MDTTVAAGGGAADTTTTIGPTTCTPTCPSFDCTTDSSLFDSKGKLLDGEESNTIAPQAMWSGVGNPNDDGGQPCINIHTGVKLPGFNDWDCNDATDIFDQSAPLCEGLTTAAPGFGK
ncbi:hypothetical protein B566_EDAN004510 [Ephemera danica]|nr:hypothetical protein B566_EDAN004510 [Ephemera danica]